MREIVLDTETTGLSPEEGHRVVEVGCVELLNHIPTGKTWHRYVNPERSMPAEALAIHGLTEDFLRKYPVFADIFQDFLDFIGESRLIIHNAGFDLGFLNAELVRAGQPRLEAGRTLDTVMLARKKFPGAPANLDDLCRRFDIDNSERTQHGALLDATLLAEVYLELQGGRQTRMDLLPVNPVNRSEADTRHPMRERRAPRPPRPHAASPEEATAHIAFVTGKIENAVWNQMKGFGDKDGIRTS